MKQTCSGVQLPLRHDLANRGQLLLKSLSNDINPQLDGANFDDV